MNRALRHSVSRGTDSLSLTFGQTAPSGREPFGRCNEGPEKYRVDRASNFDGVI